MVHSTKPSQLPKKFLAERRLKPRKILMLGCPASEPPLLATLVAQKVPGVLAFAGFNATPHEVSSFSRQGQVLTTFGCRSSAKRAISLVYHSSSVLLLFVSRQCCKSSSKSVTEL